jgi:hypothetical protein
MQRALTPARQRAALRRLARQLRAQDPELARLLSDGEPGLLPLPRFTSIPVAGYATTGAVLFVTGAYLGVASAIWWGLVCAVLAAVRHRVTPPATQAPDRTTGSGRAGTIS